MRKLLLIVVTLSLGTFALAQMAGNNSDNSQAAGNDWYNQQLAANIQQFTLIAAATAPSANFSYGPWPATSHPVTSRMPTRAH